MHHQSFHVCSGTMARNPSAALGTAKTQPNLQTSAQQKTTSTRLKAGRANPLRAQLRVREAHAGCHLELHCVRTLESRAAHSLCLPTPQPACSPDTHGYKGKISQRQPKTVCVSELRMCQARNPKPTLRLQVTACGTPTATRSPGCGGKKIQRLAILGSWLRE